MTGKLSGVTGLQWAEDLLLVVFAEKGFSKLISGDHDGAGRGHFDQSWEETFKQSAKAVLRHNPAHDAEGGDRR